MLIRLWDLPFAADVGFRFVPRLLYSLAPGESALAHKPFETPDPLWHLEGKGGASGKDVSPFLCPLNLVRGQYPKLHTSFVVDVSLPSSSLGSAGSSAQYVGCSSSRLE